MDWWNILTSFVFGPALHSPFIVSHLWRVLCSAGCSWRLQKKICRLSYRYIYIHTKLGTCTTFASIFWTIATRYVLDSSTYILGPPPACCPVGLGCYVCWPVGVPAVTCYNIDRLRTPTILGVIPMGMWCPTDQI